VIVLGQEPVNGLADDVRRAQARDVVAAIATLHAERWEVGDPARPARFSDVAVLIRSRVGLPVLEDAFRAAGVPYRLESSSLSTSPRRCANCWPSCEPSTTRPTP